MGVTEYYLGAGKHPSPLDWNLQIFIKQQLLTASKNIVPIQSYRSLKIAHFSCDSCQHTLTEKVRWNGDTLKNRVYLFAKKRTILQLY